MCCRVYTQSTFIITLCKRRRINYVVIAAAAAAAAAETSAGDIVVRSQGRESVRVCSAGTVVVVVVAVRRYNFLFAPSSPFAVVAVAVPAGAHPGLVLPTRRRRTSKLINYASVGRLIRPSVAASVARTVRTALDCHRG